MKLHLILLCLLLAMLACKKSSPDPVSGPPTVPPADTAAKRDSSFIFGVDLSFTNQVTDLGGIFKDAAISQSPYTIVKNHGHNMVRIRLWHTPTWTKTVYGAAGKQLYSDLADVEKSIGLAKANGLKVLLDFHYSDTWADPDNQEPPAAWMAIKDLGVLKDSVYRYTLNTLTYLNAKGLMPEWVQIGNETNCGMLYSKVPAGFPPANNCNDHWQNLGEIINSGINAVKEVAAISPIKTKILLHVADPQNVEWWSDNIQAKGKVTGYDMVGFSYYPIWHPTVSIGQLADKVAFFKTRYGKEVVLLETAYPWTDAYNDSYNNQFGPGSAMAGYPASQQGQYDILKDMAQAVIKGGGKGILYWAPDWISVPGMKDLWGTGSSWENSTFFDFSGNTVKAIDYPKFEYKW